MNRRYWLAAGFLLSLTATMHAFGADPDTWWHLAVGRLIDAHGIPSTEPFAFAPAAHAWIGQQWLYEVFLSHVVSGSSGAIAVVLMGLVGAGAILAAGLSAPRATPGWAVAISMVVSAFIAGQVLGVRGQVVTVFGAAVTLHVLIQWRRGNERALWVLPPLLLLWCNLHAGFVTGLALMAVFLLMPSGRAWGVSGRKKPLAITGLLSLLVTFINPAGAQIYPYVWQTFSNPVLTERITEWMSPDFHQVLMRLFEASAIALVIFWTVAESLIWSDVALGVLGIAAALEAQRNVALYAVIATPQLAQYGYSTLARVRSALAKSKRPPHTRYRQNGFALMGVVTRVGQILASRATTTGVALVICSAILTFVSVSPTVRASNDGSFTQRTYPTLAASYYAGHFGGQRLYADYALGGYLVYRFPAGRVVYIYGESAVFGSDALREYINIHVLNAHWRERLADLFARHAIVASTSPEAGAFRELGWTIDCYDPAGYVLMSAHVLSPSVTISAPPPPVAAPLCRA